MTYTHCCHHRVSCAANKCFVSYCYLMDGLDFQPEQSKSIRLLMSNKAAAAHPTQNETQPEEGFQIRPASSLSQLDQSQQLFADACQLGVLSRCPCWEEAAGLTTHPIFRRSKGTIRHLWLDSACGIAAMGLVWLAKWWLNELRRSRKLFILALFAEISKKCLRLIKCSCAKRTFQHFNLGWQAIVLPVVSRMVPHHESDGPPRCGREPKVVATRDKTRACCHQLVQSCSALSPEGYTWTPDRCVHSQ